MLNNHAQASFYSVWHLQIVLNLSCEASPSMIYCWSLLWDMSACNGQHSWDPSSGFGSHCSLPCQTLPSWLCPLQPPLLHWMPFWLQKQALPSSSSPLSAQALPACLMWCWDLPSSHLKCRFDTCHCHCAVTFCPSFLHCHRLCTTDPCNPFTEYNRQDAVGVCFMVHYDSTVIKFCVEASKMRFAQQGGCATLQELGRVLLTNQVPSVWSELWSGPEQPLAYCAAAAQKATSLGSWLAASVAGRLWSAQLNLGHLFNPGDQHSHSYSAFAICFWSQPA